MIRVICSLLFLILIFDSKAHAEEQCLSLFSVFRLEEPYRTRLTFQNVEVYRRKNTTGLQQQGDLEFIRWVELQPFNAPVENFIGLTPKGRVYHLLKFRSKDEQGHLVSRHVARPLSLDGAYKNIFYAQGGLLVAIDGTNKVSIYSPKVWQRSPKMGVIKRGIALWTATSASLLAGIHFLAPDLLSATLGPEALPLPFIGVFITALSGISTVFPMVQRYDHLNTFPDGFVTSPFIFTSLENLYQDLKSWPGWNQKTAESYVDPSHFMPVDAEDLYSPVPAIATEDIR